MQNTSDKDKIEELNSNNRIKNIDTHPYCTKNTSTISRKGKNIIIFLMFIILLMILARILLMLNIKFYNIVNFDEKPKMGMLIREGNTLINFVIIIYGLLKVLLSNNILDSIIYKSIRLIGIVNIIASFVISTTLDIPLFCFIMGPISFVWEYMIFGVLCVCLSIILKEAYIIKKEFDEII
ncbi:hypothetical protein [Peptostreptococcus equinus]|uniref:DUF2975 domain-containing protein n=1 Tax=Peptostreptococcus equinus TaxID=3003601 RepID=A0ABY7JR19_9FIRM|nr:hypothetical protein [Peptostreptococcus sp. CBA3647]WAW15806.1 hypothetical protein O0R46_04960 [Peptostreptococcus sp. CBA3647]